MTMGSRALATARHDPDGRVNVDTPDEEAEETRRTAVANPMTRHVALTARVAALHW